MFLDWVLKRCFLNHLLDHRGRRKWLFQQTWTLFWHCSLQIAASSHNCGFWWLRISSFAIPCLPQWSLSQLLVLITWTIWSCNLFRTLLMTTACCRAHEPWKCFQRISQGTCFGGWSEKTGWLNLQIVAAAFAANWLMIRLLVLVVAVFYALQEECFPFFYQCLNGLDTIL